MERKIFFSAVIILVSFTLLITSVQGQPPVPPSGHGFNGNQGAGGNAPVDGGIGILLFSGLGYGIIKVLRGRKVIR
jgi:hypothetical protein